MLKMRVSEFQYHGGPILCSIEIHHLSDSQRDVVELQRGASGIFFLGHDQRTTQGSPLIPSQADSTLDLPRKKQDPGFAVITGIRKSPWWPPSVPHSAEEKSTWADWIQVA
jgi:hypothetical protein